jgi:hypothetical protein
MSRDPVSIDWFIIYKARQCKLEDFCFGKSANECPEEQLRYFRDWDGFSLLCPDINKWQYLLIKM